MIRMERCLVLVATAIWAVTADAQSVRQPQSFETSDGPVKITPILHASTLIEAGGKVIYVDPAKVSPVTGAGADYTGLPQADLILVSDVHGDHMDPATITSLSKT